MNNLASKVLSIFYGAAVKARLSLYRSHILKPKILPCMVISIGNITVGGTGKTPMTMHIARRFVTEGSKVVILSRGYKGEFKGIGLVSNGADILMSAREAGDEPYLMAEKLKAQGSAGVPVIVGADRYKAGLFAIEKFSPDVILLDDGFQHIALARDKNIVLIDANTELEKEKLLPNGLLREPIRSLNRARIIMIKDKKERVIDPYIKAIDKPVVAFSYAAVSLRALKDGTEMELKDLKDKKCFIFSALAQPGSFERTIEDLGANVIGKKRFVDHHNFLDSDIEEINKLSREAEFVITTEKDAVRLKGASGDGGEGGVGESLKNAFILEIEVKIEKEGNFFRKL